MILASILYENNYNDRCLQENNSFLYHTHLKRELEIFTGGYNRPELNLQGRKQGDTSTKKVTMTTSCNETNSSYL